MDHATEPEVGSGTPAQNAPASEPVIDLTGKTLGDYSILRRLGQGGMGQVYLAEQISLKRKVALKLLRADLAANGTALQRFKAEALAVARATHANIVQVYAIGENDGLHFMALEYVEGRNLREYLEKKGPPDVLVALSIMRQVAAALQRASELNIIHRDIKPENILITKKGEVKVADFGLSRVFSENGPPPSLTQSNVTMGTPLYMSPEQVEGKKQIDFRTDIYSFGVTCYHLLAGQPPFRGQSAFEVALQHVQKEAPALTELRPDLPADLCALVHRMMAKDPEQRPQTGREIVREVARLRDLFVGVTGALGGAGTGLTGGLHLTGTDISLGPMSLEQGDALSTQRLRKPVPRRRWLWWLAASCTLAVASGLFAGWLYNRADVPPDPADRIDSPGLRAALAREDELKRKFNETSDVKSAIELSTYYLKDRLLDKTRALLTSLEKKDSEPSLRTLGYLNRAMLLSYEGNFKASNLLFMTSLLGRKPVAAVKERPRLLEELVIKKSLEARQLKVLLENPDIPERIGDALLVAFLEEPRKSCFQFMMVSLTGKKVYDKQFKDRIKPAQGDELTLKKAIDRNPPLKVLLENPVLRELIADALHHNRANSSLGNYPRLLQELHKPWNPS